MHRLLLEILDLENIKHTDTQITHTIAQLSIESKNVVYCNSSEFLDSAFILA